mmetsp:Transcript_23567/g.65820  ORF Transcript_23567/g.65820 Transcript_23567/m.65820 type:complete len:217 (-) Transcript_23567:453-1103(-)
MYFNAMIGSCKHFTNQFFASIPSPQACCCCCCCCRYRCHHVPTILYFGIGAYSYSTRTTLKWHSTCSRALRLHGNELQVRAHSHVHAVVLLDSLLGRFGILKGHGSLEDREGVVDLAINVGNGAHGLQRHLQTCLAHIGRKSGKLNGGTVDRCECTVDAAQQSTIRLGVPLAGRDGVVHVLRHDVHGVVIILGLQFLVQFFECRLGPHGLFEFGVK